MARRWMFVGALLVLVGGFAACSSDVAGNDLEAGDCIEDQSDLSSTEISAIDCSEEHAFEVTGTFDLDDADEYPGVAEVEAESNERCAGDIFEDYVGEPFDPTGDLQATALYPSEQTWDEADDRTVICFAFPADGSTSTGSVEG